MLEWPGRTLYSGCGDWSRVLTASLPWPQDKLLTMDPKEITFEMVSKKLQEIVLSRGKKGIDRQDQVDMLTYLATVAKGPYQKVLPLPTLSQQLSYNMVEDCFRHASLSGE